MRFMERVNGYLAESRVKIRPEKLPHGVKINDVIIGYSNIKNKRNWKNLTEKEFLAFMPEWVEDYAKRYGHTSLTNKGRISFEERVKYTPAEYRKAYQALQEYIKGDLRDADMDRNPGNKTYMILNNFFTASRDLSHGWTSKSKGEAFRNELS